MNTTQNKDGFSAVALIIIIGILVLAGAFWTGYFTKKADETTNWKTYKNDRVGVEFKYPQDWTIGHTAINQQPGPSGVELSISIVKDPYTFMAFQVIRVPNLYISATGEHLCPDDSPRLESGLDCPTFTTKKQLTINSRPAKVVDAVGEGGPFRSVEVLYKGKLYKIGQFLIKGRESELIIEDVARTLVFSE